MTPELRNLLLLGGDALIYFVVLATLFRARQRLGIGAFFCALGVMHFIETYLASTFYVTLPFGIVTSPGSSVLFAGKLMLLLLVYIREDAVVVRQPIYGLLLGNVLMVAMALLMRNHSLVALSPGHSADLGFVDMMGALMVWGTVLLFVDCILIILLYERGGSWLRGRLFTRLALSGATILTLDQLLFFAGLHVLTGAPVSVLVGGWVAKMLFVLLYSVMLFTYLRRFETVAGPRPRARISDVFDTLTYRERYEHLLAQSGRDALTGSFNRGRLETQGRRSIELAVKSRRPASLLLIDIDHFKSFNDRFGHAAGDGVLRGIAREIMATVRATDLVFRFGGEEFVAICDGLSAESALVLAERIRQQIAERDGDTAVTVSIGIATCPNDGTDYDSLFSVADRRLYQAKAAGRDCVIGITPVSDAPARLTVTNRSRSHS